MDYLILFLSCTVGFSDKTIQVQNPIIDRLPHSNRVPDGRWSADVLLKTEGDWLRLLIAFKN